MTLLGANVGSQSGERATDQRTFPRYPLLNCGGCRADTTILVATEVGHRVFGRCPAQLLYRTLKEVRKMMDLNTEQLVSKAIDLAWKSIKAATDQEYGKLAIEAATYCNEAALRLAPSPPGKISINALNQVADVIEAVITARRDNQSEPNVAELLKTRVRPN
jgi:serine kinase of HPr protein (carbohydrate metabolism regulator)